MKQFLTFALGCLLCAPIFAQSASKIRLLSNWDDPTLTTVGGFGPQQYSACWGMALNGHEYAILGSLEYTHIFDVTNPEAPKEVGKIKGVNCIWREFKTYKNRIYVANDCGGGLQIIDMSHAPDTIVKTYDSKLLVSSMHTITLDTVSGRIYGNSSPVVLDVSADPDKPKLLSNTPHPCGYAHDTYVRNDTLYASAANNGFCIYDYKDAKAPKLIASVSTNGYNHNNWLTRDGRYAYYTEEIPDGRPIRIVDLKEMRSGSIEVVGGFFDQLLSATSPSAIKAIPHNIYIKDDLLFNSQYEDGLLVYDISKPLQPRLIGWYDTYPQNSKYEQYKGCWGNYPWLPSGNIIASDMQNGLLMLKLEMSSTQTSPPLVESVEVFPNPSRDYYQVSIKGTDKAWQYQISDLQGRVLQNGGQVTRLDLRALPQGAYLLRIQFETGAVMTKQLVKI